VDSAENRYSFARQYLPGGVCVSARANEAIGHPFHVSRGDGGRVCAPDGREYVDMCMSHGASLLGHNHPTIKAARGYAECDVVKLTRCRSVRAVGFWCPGTRS